MRVYRVLSRDYEFRAFHTVYLLFLTSDQANSHFLANQVSILCLCLVLSWSYKGREVLLLHRIYLRTYTRFSIYQSCLVVLNSVVHDL